MGNVKLPEIPDEHDLSDRSTNLFKAKMPPGWRTYEPSRDIGTDLLLSVARNGAPTGERVAVQLKSSAAPTWHNESTSIRLRVSTLNSLLQAPDPAALVFYSGPDQAFYWTDLRRFSHDLNRKRGPSWQDQETVSVPLSRHQSLTTDGDFSLMVSELWAPHEFGISHIENEFQVQMREACAGVIQRILDAGPMAAEDAASVVATATGRQISPDDAVARLQDQAPSLLVQAPGGELGLTQERSLEGVRSVFNVARADAPTVLDNLGWLDSSEAEDIGRLAGDYVTEQGFPVALVKSLQQVSPGTWLAALSQILGSKPEALHHLEGVNLREDRTGPRGNAPGTIARELEFTDPDTIEAARRAAANDLQRSVMFVRSQGIGYLVETITLPGPNDPPPKLRVQGADGPGPWTRTPMLVFSDTSKRWITRLRGILPDPELPAIRTLTSARKMDVPVISIEGLSLIFRGGQDVAEQINKAIPAWRQLVDGAVLWDIVFDLDPASEWIPQSLRAEALASHGRGQDFVFEHHLYKSDGHLEIPDHLLKTIEERWGPVELGEPDESQWQ